MFGALALCAVAAGVAGAAAPPADEKELLALGFKVLEATSKVQEEWVRTLPPGKIRAMQRNGNKYFIYPDASRNRIFVGGPQENDAYLRLHPVQRKPGAQEAADTAYRQKQDQAMREASGRDASDPFLGATWYDLGW